MSDRAIIFNLDEQTRPAEDVKSAFEFIIGGRTITMIDPKEMDYRDLASIEEPSDLMNVALSAKDSEFVAGQEIPTWKFKALMDAYYEHYDLEAEIRKARYRAR